MLFDEIETNIRKTTCFYGFESSMRELMTDIRHTVASDLRRRAGEFDFVTESIIVGIADAYEKGE